MEQSLCLAFRLRSIHLQVGFVALCLSMLLLTSPLSAKQDNSATEQSPPALDGNPPQTKSNEQHKQDKITAHTLLRLKRAAALNIATSNIHYFNTALIQQAYAPLKSGPSELAVVELYYSRNGVDWVLAISDRQNSGSLNFRLPGDGDYVIKVETTDAAGNRSTTWTNPASRYMFVLDQTTPSVSLSSVPAANTDVQPEDILTLRWLAIDLNLSATPVRVEYSFDPSKHWDTLVYDQAAEGSASFRVPLHAERHDPYFLRFRVIAKDRAGNEFAEYLPRGFRILPRNIGSPPANDQMLVRDPNGFPIEILPPLNLKDVNSRVNRSNFNINYTLKNVGESGVKYVELWYTTDRGDTWTYAGRDNDKTSPFHFKAPEDGVYAFYLIIENNAGSRKGKRPMSGWFPEAAKQSLTLVDTGLPFVKLTTPRGGEFWKGYERNPIIYQVYDRTLASVDLYVSEDSGKSWKLHQKDIGTEGNFRLPTKDYNSHTMRVKIIATDASGNWTSEESERDFAIDNRMPEVEMNVIDTSIPKGNDTQDTNNGTPEDSGNRDTKPNDTSHGYNTVQSGNVKTPDYMLEARKAFEKGIGYRAQKKYSQARTMFERAIEIDPRYHGAHYEIGYLDLLNNEIAAAKEQMWKAIQLQDKAVYRAGFAKALFMEKKYSEALVQLHRVSGMEEKKAGSIALDAIWYMAKIYAMQEDYESATDMLQLLIDINDPPSHYRKAALQLNTAYAKPLAEQLRRQAEEAKRAEEE